MSPDSADSARYEEGRSANRRGHLIKCREMSVLLITSCFPSDAHISATRWYRIGKVLLGRGHKLHDIAADNRARWSIRHAPQIGYHDIRPNSLHRIPYPLQANLLHWALGGVKVLILLRTETDTGEVARSAAGPASILYHAGNNDTRLSG
jgi:hypothetical protein